MICKARYTVPKSLILVRAGNYDRSNALLDESLRIFHRLGDAFGEAWTIAHQGMTAFMVADFPAALRLVAASEAVAETISDEASTLTSLRFLQHLLRGCIALMQGNPATCRAMCEPLLAEQRRAGVRRSSYLLVFLGQAATADGSLRGRLRGWRGAAA